MSNRAREGNSVKKQQEFNFNRASKLRILDQLKHFVEDIHIEEGGREILVKGTFMVLILRALDSFARESADCWPTQQTISDYTGGCSRAKIRRGTKALADAGLLIVQRRRFHSQEKNRFTTQNVYRIAWANVRSLLTGETSFFGSVSNVPQRASNVPQDGSNVPQRASNVPQWYTETSNGSAQPETPNVSAQGIGNEEVGFLDDGQSESPGRRSNDANVPPDFVVTTEARRLSKSFQSILRPNSKKDWAYIDSVFKRFIRGDLSEDDIHAALEAVKRVRPDNPIGFFRSKVRRLSGVQI